MEPQTEVDDEPLIRVMALHALAYCERLFYLEEVEEIRVADERVFAGRALHAEIADEGTQENRAFELASTRLGIRGRVDAVRYRDGSWIPYEHKRGRAARGPDGAPQAWPSDRLQVAAYGMLLEEHLGQPVYEGRIRYHADNVTVRVSLDEETRSMVRQALERARLLRSSTRRPPVTTNERLCLRCSLAPVCLPEEERLAENREWEPIRLLPASRDRLVLHVTHPNAKIGRAGNRLVVHEEDSERSYPIHRLGSVLIHGFAQMTTQALRLCADHCVPVHWITQGGRYVAGLQVGAGPVQRRLRQYEALTSREFRMALARRLVQAKIEGQIRYVLRATRGTARSPAVSAAIAGMRTALRSASRAAQEDELRGAEGLAGRHYFHALSHLIPADEAESMRPAGRSRRPPRDRFNAALSFGYALLYSRILATVLAVGIEPAIGFYHRPRSAAHPLVLDLMELFRVPVWDMALIGSINRRQWDPDGDFDIAGDQVWLTDSGRRKAIELFERRLQERWKHPVVGYSLSYERTIELEVRLLEKEWSGAPGLFAQSRLR